MNEFLLVFKGGSPEKTYPSREGRGEYMHRWGLWMKKLIKKGLWGYGSLLVKEGLIVSRDNKVINFVPLDPDETVNGFALIRIETLSDAANIVKDCPILEVGGIIEIRESFPSPQ